MRRPLSLLAVPIVAALLAAVNALAGDDTAQSAREPAVTASANLRLPALDRCVRGDSVRIGLIPPAGVTFASLSVRLGDEDILQLAGLAGPGSVKLMLPRGSVNVVASATTSGGQFISATQTYHRCAGTPSGRPTSTPMPKKPRPEPETPYLQGGGVD